MSQRKLIGLSGLFIILIGIFTPIAKFGDTTISYFTYGKRFSDLVAVILIISFVLILKESYKKLMIASIIILIFIVTSFYEYFSAVNFIHETTSAYSIFANKLGTNLGDVANLIPQLSYGWALLFVGNAILLFASFYNDKIIFLELTELVKPKNRTQPAEEHKICPYCAEKIKLEAILCRYCNRELNTQN